MDRQAVGQKREQAAVAAVKRRCEVDPALGDDDDPVELFPVETHRPETPERLDEEMPEMMPPDAGKEPAARDGLGKGHPARLRHR